MSRYQGHAAWKRRTGFLVPRLSELVNDFATYALSKHPAKSS